MRKEGTSILVLLLILFVLQGGCLSTSPDHSTADPQRGPLPGPGITNPLQLNGYSLSHPASVYITYPEFDGGVDAGNVIVTMGVRNFSLVKSLGKPVIPGEGHIVCFRDIAPRTEPGLSAETLEGTFQISFQASCTWNNVSPGTHTFSVELVNNDNTPLVPAVIDAVDVTAVERTF